MGLDILEAGTFIRKECMSEKDDLLKSAEDALARGFAIFPCLPHKKEPFSKYAPNGFKNASRNPVIALKAWHDGEPANYGIACGETGLTVVDLDTGINNYEEFIVWRISRRALSCEVDKGRWQSRERVRLPLILTDHLFRTCIPF